MKRKVYEAKAASRKAKSTLKKLSGKVLRRKKFRERAMKGESLCLAVQHFGSGSYESMVVTKEVREGFVKYEKTRSAIDTGASVSITDLRTYVKGLDPGQTVSIKASMVTRQSLQGLARLQALYKILKGTIRY